MPAVVFLRSADDSRDDGNIWVFRYRPAGPIRDEIKGTIKTPAAGSNSKIRACADTRLQEGPNDDGITHVSNLGYRWVRIPVDSL